MEEYRIKNLGKTKKVGKFKPFIKLSKYQEDKMLGVNLCYEVFEKWNFKEDVFLILKFKEIYINICLIWFNIVIGIRIGDE